MPMRSPNLAVTMDAGMLLIKEPMPIKATTSAAPAREEPMSRALSGMTGKMAPSPMPNNRDGPNAGTAMDHRLKSPGSAVLLTVPTLVPSVHALPSGWPVTCGRAGATLKP